MAETREPLGGVTNPFGGPGPRAREREQNRRFFGSEGQPVTRDPALTADRDSRTRTFGDLLSRTPRAPGGAQRNR